MTGRPGVGLVSATPWRVRVPAGDGVHRVLLPGVLAGHEIATGDELRWAVLPVGLPEGVTDVECLADLDDLWAGTAATLDLVLDGGAHLSGGGVTDRYGVALDPAAHAAARHTWVDQWNRRRVGLDGSAGRVVTAVEVVVRASPAREVVLHLDDIAIGPAPRLASDAVDQVRTTRGSNSARAFSRGNTAPLAGVPQGRFYAVPVTDASDPGWLYRWQPEGPAGDPRPRLQAIATSHLPSPWIADRGAVQVMPARGASPALGRTERGLAFDHATERDGPHLWAADLEGGVGVEATAGDDVAALRCRFPEDDGWLVLDHRGEMQDVAITHDTAAGTVTVTGVLDDAEQAPPQHVHLLVRGAAGHTLSVTEGRLRGAVQVRGRSAEVVIGLSSLDADTAAAHVAAAPPFQQIVAEARRRWQRLLATVTVEGASDDQLVTLRSSLYRLFLYPTRHDEPVGQQRRWRSPYAHVPGGPLRAPELGPQPEIGIGRYSATNGFWDTYRTAWPLLGLLDPEETGRHAEGFLQHFRDSGWMPRWSAPAAQDCMTGTTSDTVLADLVVTGVPGIDLHDAWRSALVHASVPPTDARIGRKGLHPGLFRRYVSTQVPEGMSWTLDAALNDWSASRLGRAYAASLPASAERDRIEAECEWLERRSVQYAEVFHPETGFFLGRDAHGAWRLPAEAFDPDDWGGDYTETNAWGTAVTVPHDGAGLARLHGGEAALAAMLDRIVARPETGAARHAGSYGQVIHEMTEARDCRMGMIALSNQPAHHIPFMYMHTGRHDDAHALVGDALDRLFVGSDLGQGCPGDEDNGEMSAWWVLCTIGLYPLVPASDTYVLLPPRVPRTVVTPVGASRPLEIVVTNPSAGGRFIRSVRIDGEPWHEISVPGARLRAGARIEVERSPTPCGWAATSRPVSASAIHGFTEPLTDVTAGAHASHPALVDDIGSESVALEVSSAVELSLGDPQRLGDLMTLTAAEPQTIGWRLHARTPQGWLVLDERAGEVFERTGQTRVFRTSGAFDGVTDLRLAVTGPARIRQIEVFAP